jgi:hypothetical protein
LVRHHQQRGMRGACHHADVDRMVDPEHGSAFRLRVSILGDQLLLAGRGGSALAAVLRASSSCGCLAGELRASFSVDPNWEIFIVVNERWYFENIISKLSTSRFSISTLSVSRRGGLACLLSRIAWCQKPSRIPYFERKRQRTSSSSS